MKDKIISVITTFYNAEQFLLNAVNSVFTQTVCQGQLPCYKVEYVLVDDKSPDNSRALLEEYIKNHQTPYIIWKLIEPKENLGCGGARKFGIDNASGDYLMFLDADDYYMKTDFIARAVQDIEREEADIIEYGIMYNQPDGSRSNSTSPNKVIIQDPHSAELALFRDNLIKFNVWSKIYRRWIADSYPYSTTRMFEDVRTIPVWVSNAKKIVVMPSCEVNYRAAGSSIIRTNWVETRLGTISAIAELFPRFKDDPEVLKAMYARSMIDIEALLNNHSSENEGFVEMSKLNTRMLKYIYPNTWKDKVFHDDGFLEELEKEESTGNAEEPKPSLNPSDFLKSDLNTLPGL